MRDRCATKRHYHLSRYFIRREDAEFTSISRKLMYTTARALQNRLQDTVFEAIMEIITFYNVHGKEVEYIMSDNKFGPLKAIVREEGGAEMNLASPNEHSPEVERKVEIYLDRYAVQKIPKNFKREFVLSDIEMDGCSNNKDTPKMDKGMSSSSSLLRSVHSEGGAQDWWARHDDITTRELKPNQLDF